MIDQDFESHEPIEKLPDNVPGIQEFVDEAKSHKKQYTQEEIESISEELETFRDYDAHVSFSSDTISASELLEEAGMARDKEYYGSSPADVRYVNGVILMRTFYLLQYAKGEDAALNFMRMVFDAESLAPGDLYDQVDNLSSNNWHYTPRKRHSVQDDMSYAKKALDNDPKTIADDKPYIQDQFGQLLAHAGYSPYDTSSQQP